MRGERPAHTISALTATPTCQGERERKREGDDHLHRLQSQTSPSRSGFDSQQRAESSSSVRLEHKTAKPERFLVSLRPLSPNHVSRLKGHMESNPQLRRTSRIAKPSAVAVASAANEVAAIKPKRGAFLVSAAD